MFLPWDVLGALRCLKAICRVWENNHLWNEAQTLAILPELHADVRNLNVRATQLVNHGDLLTPRSCQHAGPLPLQRGHSGCRQCFHPNRKKSRAQCTHFTAFYWDSGKALWRRTCSLSQFAQAFRCVGDSICDCVGHRLRDFLHHLVPCIMGLL